MNIIITVSQRLLQSLNLEYKATALAMALTFSASAGATMALSAEPCWPACKSAVIQQLTPTPTLTPAPTQTPAPTRTRAPLATKRPTPSVTPFVGALNVQPQTITVRLSWYWPALGGTNCYHDNWRDGVCVTRLLGQPWGDWVGAGAACPPSVPLKARIYIERLKKSFYCVDRGGAIEDLPDGTKFVDLLQSHPITFPDWNIGIIVDQWCPRGCYTSEAYVH